MNEITVSRELLGGQVSQKSQSEFLSATDLIKIANKWRNNKGLELRKIEQYFKLESTKEFCRELELSEGVIKINGKGKNRHTWVHPLLFVDMALWMSPSLKVKVYKWLYDSLLKYRNSSGDSYKKMSGSIYSLLTNKAKMPEAMKWTANKIKESLGVEDWNRASESQLEMRDRIHNNICVLGNVLRDIPQVVEIAIKQEIGE